jgi:hypothetical protein
MGLYDVVMGDGRQQERGALLLQMLGSPTVTRFRDAWAEKGDAGEPVIAIYTRQGGGNRQCYCEELEREHVPEQCYAACNEELARHPLYVRDADDEFDATYATFYFRAPDQFRALLAAAAVDHVNMSERWQAAIDRVKAGELRPAETAMADQLGAFLTDPDPGDGPRIMEI